MSTDDDATAAADETPAALGRAVAEIEQHVRADGWDQPPRLYALAPTGELIEHEPDLAAQLGIDPQADLGDALTPIEQDVSDRSIDELLPTITWPESVHGCALAVERIVLPPGAEESMPDDDAAATQWAQQHPSRSDVRVVVGVLRDGSRAAVLRVRGHDGDDELVHGAELSPELGDALSETLS
ncbi:hypothetical protein CLV30_10216 [Haloactinopolyspora alba]|uniref:Uncharacterized protein n=1 Tax=Haloactinopolyspora alba TaxID=648780 RepID=A0A2P8EAY5_9ACTN|nr:PPA1309 family protein [Haloactinopolyspora alba]PSL06632.1 hypothetical protein CLV30_10216 [Haloactinopolyspora alba]